MQLGYQMQVFFSFADVCWPMACNNVSQMSPNSTEAAKTHTCLLAHGIRQAHLCTTFPEADTDGTWIWEPLCAASHEHIHHYQITMSSYNQLVVLSAHMISIKECGRNKSFNAGGPATLPNILLFLNTSFDPYQEKCAQSLDTDKSI